MGEKEDAERAARSHERYLASVTDASADAILSLDTTGVIRSWNRGAESIFGYAAGEMKHGPIALIDEHMPVVAVVSKGLTFEKMLSNMEEVKARRGKIIAVSNDPGDTFMSKVDGFIPVPAASEQLAPILFTIPLQLLAYHVAVIRGTDVDQPRNLAKSVTVE